MTSKSPKVGPGNAEFIRVVDGDQFSSAGGAVVGSLSTLISMPLGTAIGQGYNNTVLLLFIGLTALAGLSHLCRPLGGCQTAQRRRHHQLNSPALNSPR